MYAFARTMLCLSFALTLLSGCGTTRSTDTARAATEQMLVSSAIDQTVSRMDFRFLDKHSVFFDPQYLDGTVDKGYLISSIRQHLLACGALLQEDRTKATFVVEARSGSVGTDRYSVLLGVPQMNMPVVVPGAPSSIPEIPIVKRTDQSAIAKVGVYAFNRLTGERVWQSGTLEAKATSKDLWVLGAGPFQKGTVKKGMSSMTDLLPVNPFENEREVIPAAGVAVTQSAGWAQTIPIPVQQPAKAIVAAPAKLPPQRDAMTLPVSSSTQGR